MEKTIYIGTIIGAIGGMYLGFNIGGIGGAIIFGILGAGVGYLLWGMSKEFIAGIVKAVPLFLVAIGIIIVIFFAIVIIVSLWGEGKPKQSKQNNQSQSVEKASSKNLTSKTESSPVRKDNANNKAKPSFDCAKAKTNIEKIICNNELLSEADNRLAIIYSRVRKSLPKSNATQLKKEQNAWIKQRDFKLINTCLSGNQLDIKCSLQLWEERIKEIERLSGEKTGKQTPISSSQESINKIDAKAVWSSPNGEWEKIEKMCGEGDLKCISAEMQKMGASQEAIKFTMLMKGEVYMSSFHKMGKVDLAEVTRPLLRGCLKSKI